MTSTRAAARSTSRRRSQFAAGSTFVFQWNEPFDPIPPTPVGPPLVQGVGTVPAGGDDEFTFNGTAGQLVEIFVDADTRPRARRIPT